MQRMETEVNKCNKMVKSFKRSIWYGIKPKNIGIVFVPETLCL